MRATWYVLEDDTAVDPADVAPDDKGVLRHKDGLAVAMRYEDIPRTRGVDVEEKPAEDDAARKAAADAEAKRKAEEEAVAKKKAGDEEASRKAAEEAGAKKAKGSDREMKPGKAKNYKTR